MQRVLKIAVPPIAVGIALFAIALGRAVPPISSGVIVRNEPHVVVDEKEVSGNPVSFCGTEKLNHAPHDPRVRHFVDRKAKKRIPHDITSRISSLGEHDLPAVVTVLLNIEDSDTARNEAANMLRRAGHGGLSEDLVAVLNRPNESERFRAFCIQHLSTNFEKADEEERTTIADALQKSLSDRHVAVRREALLALVRSGDPTGIDAAIAWLEDADAAGVKDLAIRCLRELNLREHLPLIRDLLGHPEEAVRIAAMVTLSEWGDQESLEAIRGMLQSGSVRQRNVAMLALRRLDGGN